MKLSIALAAAVVLSALRAAAAEDGAAAAGEDFSAAPPPNGQATELGAPAVSGAIVHSQGSTAVVVLVFVAMTVIAYRRLDRTTA